MRVLNWARRPDRVFHEIVGEALDQPRARLEDWNVGQQDAAHPGSAAHERVRWFDGTMPRSARLFTPEQMLSLLRRLADGHRDEAALYRCTDYHWLVLYESLARFVEVHNDAAGDAPTRLAAVGPYRVGQIDFDDLVDAFFHDTDFLLDVLVDAPESVRRQLGVSPEMWGLVAGLPPHPDEIVLTPLDDAGDAPFQPRPGPRTKRLAAYPPARITVRTEWYFGEGAAADWKGDRG